MINIDNHFTIKSMPPKKGGDSKKKELPPSYNEASKPPSYNEMTGKSKTADMKHSKKAKQKGFNAEKGARQLVDKFGGENKKQAHKAISAVKSGKEALGSGKVQAFGSSLKNAVNKFDLHSAVDVWKKGKSTLRDKKVQKFLHGARSFFEGLGKKGKSRR